LSISARASSYDRHDAILLCQQNKGQFISPDRRYRNRFSMRPARVSSSSHWLFFVYR